MVAADVAPLVLGDTVLERYRTIELIAKGGHSVVYRGRDERLERPVCIKVFTSVPGDAGTLASVSGAPDNRPDGNAPVRMP